MAKKIVPQESCIVCGNSPCTCGAPARDAPKIDSARLAAARSVEEVLDSTEIPATTRDAPHALDTPHPPSWPRRQREYDECKYCDGLIVAYEGGAWTHVLDRSDWNHVAEPKEHDGDSDT